MTPVKPSVGRELRALKRIGNDILNMPFGITASGKESIRSKAGKMRTSFSAPMAVSRMKALYRLRKNKNWEDNPTDIAVRRAGWYLTSLSSDSGSEYYCEDKHFASSGGTDCKDLMSEVPSKAPFLTDGELKFSSSKPHSCSRNFWASKVQQSNSDRYAMDEALYSMSSFCSTVSTTSTDCESYAASAKSRSSNCSSYNSDYEGANFNVSQILLELDREERSDSESD